MTEKIYCCRCKDKIEIESPKEVTIKNGNLGVFGVCPKCGTKVYKLKSKYYDTNDYYQKNYQKIKEKIKKINKEKEESRIQLIIEQQSKFNKTYGKPGIVPIKIIEKAKKLGFSEEFAIAFVMNGELLDVELKKKGIILGD